jgi:Fur family ferric uptake transcriptional regulator
VAPDFSSSSLSGDLGHLRVLLKQEGFRLTLQRQKFLEIFQSLPVGDHFGAEEIHQSLAAAGESIGISTIYRALHLMVNMGLLRELDLAEGRKLYELATPFVEQHHHLVCVQCGTVQEFEDASMATVGLDETEKRGFALLDCQFTVYAVCPTCQERVAFS